MKTGGGEWMLAALASARCLLALLVRAALSVPDWRAAERSNGRKRCRRSRRRRRSAWACWACASIDPIAPMRHAGYLLPFEIVSVHLLVVLVGAAYLARAEADDGACAG